MNLSHKLFDTLSLLGLKYCACVSGGGIMYLLDALGQNKDINTFYFHHEQSAGIAAEAYSKSTSQPSICLVTIGPGVANAVSAAFSAYINSVPVVFISGSKRSTVPTNYQLQRFTFPQDVDTRALVTGVVKGFWELSSVENLDSTLYSLVNLARSGRPGPVWLSVPLDFQGKPYEINDLTPTLSFNKPGKISIYEKLRTFISNSNRTIVITGDGVNAVVDFESYQSFVKYIGLPFITSIGSNHTILNATKLNLGVFGPVGRRSANIALTNADSLIVFGSGLDIDITGFDRVSFFKNKKVFLINTDPDLFFSEALEFEKTTTDLKQIDFNELAELKHNQTKWAEACIKLNEVLSPEFEIDFHNNDGLKMVDPYLFTNTLGRLLPESTGIVAGISLDVVSLSHSIMLEESHRLYISKHCGQLGWDLPAAIGVAHTNKFKNIICLTGDGSIMFNLQELATLNRVKQRVCIFIYDNDGYNSIRTSQSTHLENRWFGSTLEDISFPNWSKLAESFGFLYFQINTNNDIKNILNQAFKSTRNSITLIKVDQNRSRTPRLVSKIIDGKFQSPKLSEQYPYLDQKTQDVVDNLMKIKR